MVFNSVIASSGGMVDVSAAFEAENPQASFISAVYDSNRIVLHLYVEATSSDGSIFVPTSYLPSWDVADGDKAAILNGQNGFDAAYWDGNLLAFDVTYASMDNFALSASWRL